MSPTEADRLAPGALLGAEIEVGGERPGWTIAPLYDGHRRSDGAAVIVKVLDPVALGQRVFGEPLSLCGDAPDLLARFARAPGEGVAPVVAAGNQGGVFFVAMAPVEGEPLHARLGRGAAPELLEGARELLRALGELHASWGPGHGRLQPDNLLVTPDRRLVAPELALRSLADRAIAQHARTLARVGWSRPGAEEAYGYRAPEQHRGAADSPRTDQFSMALVVAELLTGAPLVQGASAATRAAQVLRGPALVPRHAPHERALRRALAIDPSERFSDCAAFADALREKPGRPTRLKRLKRLLRR